jgi:FkbM family methyltransferase
MYVSQYDQDRFLDKVVFNRKKNGFFLDIGAHDGKTLSNTYFFEKERGFKGICFEPNPKVFETLQKNRHCTLLNKGVGRQNGRVQFMAIEGYAEMLSGVVNNYDPAHLERIEENLKEKGGHKKIIEIDLVRLDSIAELRGIVVDYCNIDTEGSELEILNSIDLDLIRINAFTVENNYGSVEIREFLESRGYRLFFLSGDEFYIRSEMINGAMKFRRFLYRLRNKIKTIFK